VLAAEKEEFGHAGREDRKRSGATYTPLGLAGAVAGRLLDNLPSLGKLRILDPGCGDGTLTDALLSRLPAERLTDAKVICIDTNKPALAAARARLEASYPEVTFTFLETDFIDYALAAEACSMHFDLIIANPPYVRIQALDEALREKIRKGYGLTGRTDLAFAFILAILRLLHPDGKAGIITSNRLLSTGAGKPVRSVLLESACLEEIWDLGDSRLFDAAVLPAVIFFGRRSGQETGTIAPVFTSLYEEIAAENPGDGKICQDICTELDRDMIKITPCGRRLRQRRGALVTEGTWRLGDVEDLAWARQVSGNTWKRFEEVSRISVGIKTTADKVFISDSWIAPEPELLRPLVTHHVAGRYRATGLTRHKVLYTHEIREGRREAVDLTTYPASSAYLSQHRARLEARKYVIEAGRQWFEIWVPHSPADWIAPKIVFRDISERPTFWIEDSGSVVNGDCYWIRPQDSVDADLIWLMLAVGNSAMIEKFYDITFNERLYAGRRRFMTRHVRQFPIPDPGLPSSRRAAAAARRLAQECLDPFERDHLEALVDREINTAFGLN